MSRENRDQRVQEEDNRLQWQRPAFRRLATECAEGGGPNQDEGNNVPNGTHSSKSV
jgi:hypothetical protein